MSQWFCWTISQNQTINGQNTCHTIKTVLLFFFFWTSLWIFALEYLPTLHETLSRASSNFWIYSTRPKIWHEDLWLEDSWISLRRNDIRAPYYFFNVIDYMLHNGVLILCNCCTIFIIFGMTWFGPFGNYICEFANKILS